MLRSIPSLELSFPGSLSRGAFVAAKAWSNKPAVLASLRQKFPPTAAQEQLEKSAFGASGEDAAAAAAATPLTSGDPLQFDERAYFGSSVTGSAAAAVPSAGKTVETAAVSDIYMIGLHGWLDNAGTWDLLAPLLLQQQQLQQQQQQQPASGRSPTIVLVALDLPGHGLTSHLAGTGSGYMLHSYVRETMNVVDQLGWKQFGLLAHSMGAAVSCLLASAYPDRVQFGIFLENLGPISSPVERLPQQLRMYVSQMKSLPTKRMPLYASFAEALQARRNSDQTLTERGAQCLVRRGLKKVELPRNSSAADGAADNSSAEKYTWRTDQQLVTVSGASYSEEQTLAILASVECPVVLVLGRAGYRLLSSSHKSDPFSWIDWSKRFRTMRDIQMWEYSGGHHLHLDEQGALAEGLPKNIAQFIQQKVRMPLAQRQQDAGKSKL